MKQKQCTKTDKVASQFAKLYQDGRPLMHLEQFLARSGYSFERRAGLFDRLLIGELKVYAKEINRKASEDVIQQGELQSRDQPQSAALCQDNSSTAIRSVSTG